VVHILPVVQVAAIQVAAAAVHLVAAAAVHLVVEVLHPDVVNPLCSKSLIELKLFMP
jgi:S-adenosylmethionine/arginine decarboxylase-like enzyme